MTDGTARSFNGTRDFRERGVHTGCSGKAKTANIRRFP